jgi:dinuclear metal center YbgI/SA1388 family protein
MIKMKLTKLITSLEQIAPPHLAEDWDNVGLLVGNRSGNTKRAMLTIDLTAEVFAEAKQKKIDLIIAYHPPIWDPLKKIVAGEGAVPLLYDVIRADMSIYTMHTGLDSAIGGINDVLAEIVGISNPQPLQQLTPTDSQFCKLAVFVPKSEIAKVSEAVFATGGGRISQDSNYSKCSFRSEGTGTFKCHPQSKPTIGKPGSFEQVDEIRFETVLPTAKLAPVIKAMLKAHSYEEPAYDIFPMLLPPDGLGLGRCGDLDKPVSVNALLTKIKKQLKTNVVGLIGPKRRQVKRAAVGAGSCGTILRDVIRHGCDFYLTGELKHHHAIELQEAGVTTACVSHTVSERLMLPRIARTLRRDHPTLDITVSTKDRDPFTWA